MAPWNRLLNPALEQWTGLTPTEVTEWADRERQLTEYWEWFTGDKLAEEDAAAPVGKDGKRPLKYPLQINPITTAARVHSFALWGEVQDTSEPLVRIVVEPPDEDDEENAAVACRYCGAGVKPDARSCPKCGGPLPGAGQKKPTPSDLPVQGQPQAGSPPSNATRSGQLGAPGSSQVTDGTVSPPQSAGNAGDTKDRRAAQAGLAAPDPAEDPKLAGQLRDDMQREQAKEEGRKLALKAQRALHQVLYENNTRALLVECGLLAQPLGGVVLKIGWDAEEVPERPSRLRLEHYDPRYFHCRWLGRDYWNLTEAWIKVEISAAEAAAYGIKELQNGRTALYVEYWSKEKFFIRIDGKQIEGGKNPWGFVPFIYIPHERIGGMWGRSVVPEVIGLVKELNSRMADMGDAVHLGVNSLILMWNLKNGYPIEQTLPNGQPFINMGRAISQGDPQPGGERLDPPNLPVGAPDFNNALLDQARTYLMTPSIAYGEEEGSQRSGQTLYQRMWPLLSHVRQERTLWTTGLALLSEMILRILAKKHMLAITDEHLGLRKRVIWAEMVPVDRAALTDEMIQRKSTGLASTFHALQRFGDVEDIEEEIDRIKADTQAEAEVAQAQSAQQMAGEQQQKSEDRQFQADESEKDRHLAADTEQVKAKTQIAVAKSKPRPGGGGAK